MRKCFLFLVVSTLLAPFGGQNEDQDSFGIDVSHHNGKINWDQVPDVDFVYIKATEGATYVDPVYQQNINGARARKFRVGAYHYFRTTSSVQKQFENYKKHVMKSDIDLIPMVDVEECKKWSVKSHYGKAPMIYSVNTFYNKYCAPRFNNFHLIIGRYGNEKPFIKGKGTYTIWQKSQTGKLSGIPKEVDIDVFRKEVLIANILLNS